MTNPWRVDCEQHNTFDGFPFDFCLIDAFKPQRAMIGVRLKNSDIIRSPPNRLGE